MISVQHLTKNFTVHERIDAEGPFAPLMRILLRRKRVVSALRDISFQVSRGEVVGYIGANGAGKSTTIKILTGILIPTSGQVLVDGRNPFVHRKRNARQLGVVFGQRSQLWWDLPVIDSYELLYRIYSLSRAAYRENLDYLTHVLEVQGLLQTPVRLLSLGQRIRCEIAAALLHNPSLVILDEPTIGLDIFVKDRIRTMIRQLNRERNTTFLITSHDIDDITETCSRIIILSQGAIDFDGTLPEFKKLNTPIRTLVFEVREKEPNITGLVGSSGNLAVAEHSIRISYDADSTIPIQMAMAIMEQNQIVDMRIEDVDIENILKQKYGDQHRATT